MSKDTGASMPTSPRRQYEHSAKYLRTKTAKRVERDTIILWRELRSLSRCQQAGWKIPAQVRNVIARLAREGATPRIRRIAKANKPVRGRIARKDGA